VASNEWRNYSVVTSFGVGQDGVRLRFNYKSGLGNDIYLDNVRISKNVSAQDLAAETVSSILLAPNPTNTNTSLRLEITEANPLTLEVYDLQGRLVSRSTQSLSAGAHSVNVPLGETAGIYSVRATLGQKTYTFKAVKL
jgi:hypothetical protein